MPPGVILRSYCPAICVGVYGAAIGDIAMFSYGLPDGGTYGAILKAGAVGVVSFAFAMLDNTPDAINAFVGVAHDGNLNESDIDGVAADT